MHPFLSSKKEKPARERKKAFAMME